MANKKNWKVEGNYKITNPEELGVINVNWEFENPNLTKEEMKQTKKSIDEQLKSSVEYGLWMLDKSKTKVEMKSKIVEA